MAKVIKCKRGDTLAIPFRFTEVEGGVAPLDGVTFRLQVRNQAKEVVADLPALGQGLELDAENGLVTAVIEPEITRTFLLQKHYTDLEVTYPSGWVDSSETVTLDIEEDQTV